MQKVIIKELSSFNVMETEKGHFGAPECFAIIFKQDTGILKGFGILSEWLKVSNKM